MGTLQEKLKYLGETKEQLKFVAVAHGVAVGDATPFREYPQALEERLARLDLLEKFERAAQGKSFQDWNPYPIDPDETATFEEAPAKYMIAVETRGITYYVRGDSPRVNIYPDMGHELNVANATGHVDLPVFFATNDGMATKELYQAPVFDASRYTVVNAANGGIAPNVCWRGFLSEGTPRSFIALPERCQLSGKFHFICNTSQYFLAQGLSFGKWVSGMTVNSFLYSQLSVGDKPVYVMEGFKGNLYLAKLNISAEHLLGIIKNLGEGSYALNIGSHNIAKLTTEQIEIAEAKGWTVT